MRFVSTRGSAAGVSLAEAIDGGTAPDGGLWVPDPLPSFAGLGADPGPSPGGLEVNPLSGDPDSDHFASLAVAASAPWFRGEAQAERMARATRGALDIQIELCSLGPTVSRLDLTRGPSAAFKDVGARFLAALWSAVPSTSGRTRTVLVATSGDTGGAVAAAVRGHPGLRAVIVYPEAGVSEVQRRQFTTPRGNVTAVSIPGPFDQAQSLVRTLFMDRARGRELGLVSANSINPGRLLPQTLYYLHLSRILRRSGLDPQEHPVIVPTGNVGNVMAAVWARAMGARLGPIHAAVNENDALVRAVAEEGSARESARREGTAEREGGLSRETVSTDSTAMDVGRPSNLERLMAYAQSEGVAVGSLLAAHSVPIDEARAAQKRAAREADLLIDPHTAVGYAVALRLQAKTPGVRPVVLETAHPAKFPGVLERVTGRTPAPPNALREDLGREEIVTRLDPHPEALAQLITELADGERRRADR